MRIIIDANFTDDHLAQILKLIRSFEQLNPDQPIRFMIEDDTCEAMSEDQIKEKIERIFPKLEGEDPFFIKIKKENIQ